MIEIRISKKEENQKAFTFVKKYLSNVPLSLIYKTFRKKDVKVNGKRIKEDYLLKEDDLMQIYINTAIETNDVPNVKISFQVLYEDENLLAVLKPQGLLVTEDHKEKNNTLANQVIRYLVDKGEYNPSSKGFTPSPLHRIDRNTSGIVLIGKNMEATQFFMEMFRSHKHLIKSYKALCKGVIKENGCIDSPLIKDSDSSLVRLARKNENGLQALTFYEVKENIKDYTLLNVTIKTGRTHQIRVHLASKGYPLIGDNKYGDFLLNKEFKKKYGWDNQFLHASKVSFEDIDGKFSYLNDLIIEAPLPHENILLLNKLRSE